MPLQLGSSGGWAPLKNLSAGSTPVVSAILATENGLVELWRSTPGLPAPVTENGRIAAPAWALYADLILIGGGGGGSGGNGGNGAGGSKGSPGEWSQTSRVMKPGLELIVSIGAGGKGGTANNVGPGSPGGTTKVSASDSSWMLSAAGGAPGVGTSTGQGDAYAPSLYRFTGGGEPWEVTGGGAGRYNLNGPIPGGGGGQGDGGIFNGAQAGRPGGRGQVWVRFRPG